MEMIDVSGYVAEEKVSIAQVGNIKDINANGGEYIYLLEMNVVV